MSTPNASTIVVNLSKAGQPDLDGRRHPRIRPGHAQSRWAKDSANGSILDFTNPANAAKIFKFLTAAVQVGVHLRDQPAVADR